MNLNIRELKEADIIKGIEVLYSSFGRSITKNQIMDEKRIWKKMLEKNIGKFIISEVNENIAGIGGVFFLGDVCSFGYMAVLHHYRGKGLGTSIFRKLFETAADRGCKKMILYASPLGEPIYRRFGFMKSYYGSMYNLPKTLPSLKSTDKHVKILNHLPNWLLDLDREAIGFNRKEYFELKLTLGSKVLVIEKEAFGFITKVLNNLRLGPLISRSLDSALNIMARSIELQANQIILTEHNKLPKKIFEVIRLNKVENGSNSRMAYGDKIIESLDLIYAAATFAKT